MYVVNNVDHNLRTLDGHGTFHGMGLIVAATPASNQRQVVPRMPPAHKGIEYAKIAIKYYKHLTGKSSPLVYRKLPRIEASDHCKQLDVLVKISWPLRPTTPSWSGMMQTVCKGTHPGKASIHFLPMLDLDPNDVSCIYSTLHFVAEQNQRQGTEPVLTFDQPLWWKARKIILNEGEGSALKPIVLILGSFHTTMSFLGSIGHTMHESGLKEVLELIYSENAVTHMLTGKAYASRTWPCSGRCGFERGGHGKSIHC